MRTLIIFSSSHGTTEKAAQLLKKQLNGEVELINLKKLSNPPLTDYDSVILGSSIYAGSVKSKVKQFIKQNQKSLMTKHLGLFLCCMFEGEKAEQQFETTYPKELREHSKANGLFGGEFMVSKMNFIERQIVKKVAGVTSDVSKINVEEIERFAKKLNA
ncbi:flavodoxin domain-containing protein [Desulfosporosinus nitroreducens]|uniref:Flavodoxin domain-containing protein n=1 Tax=Desulfosporosinus nitroreducens TaxID=2018668 RepID=A0ABT8QWQ9_9FIRM|nr:flavodoxin domain-containing protein [Desulfosporosinus nitroreducens]MCO1604244.1 flavodoxin domain-containing protein [Desulfosporosinus nitroreducens]MDO0825771.1 flavodoxin domain-containing protein [Desulfosporosinus nitroreducens]